jgi:hypothetical protein
MCKFRHRCRRTHFNMGAEYEGYRANMRRLPLIASTPMEATNRLARIEATTPLVSLHCSDGELSVQKEKLRPTVVQPVWSHAAQGAALLILDDGGCVAGNEKGGSMVDLFVFLLSIASPSCYLLSASDLPRLKTSSL